MDDWLQEYYKLQQTDWSPTALSKAEEPEFRDWLTSTQLFNNLKPLIAKDLDKPVDKISNDEIINEMLSSGEYDYRGAWKKGVTEEISPYDNMPHWSSRAADGTWLKSPKHQTAWKELFMQQYGQDPDSLGLDTLDKAIQAVPAREQIVNPAYADPFGNSIQ
jgi:hypothetical protein